MNNSTITLPLLAAVGALLVALPLVEAANALTVTSKNIAFANGGSISQQASNVCNNSGCHATFSSTPSGQCHTTQTANSITTICSNRR